MRSIQAPELAALLKEHADLELLDVREPWEVQTASIPEATRIPMGEIAARVGELDAARTTVVMCHKGGRSARVAGFLEQHGFRDVVNLEGGIDGWAAQVDPDIPRY